MNLNWKEYMLMHWPYIVAIAFGAITVIYTSGFKAGQTSILRAAEESFKDSAKSGGMNYRHAPN